MFNFLKNLFSKQRSKSYKSAIIRELCMIYDRDPFICKQQIEARIDELFWNTKTTHSQIISKSLSERRAWEKMAIKEQKEYESSAAAHIVRTHPGSTTRIKSEM
jgi:hypothetical protein